MSSDLLSNPAFVHYFNMCKSKLKHKMHLEVNQLVDSRYDQVLADLQLHFATLDGMKNEIEIDNEDDEKKVINLLGNDDELAGSEEIESNGLPQNEHLTQQPLNDPTQKMIHFEEIPKERTLYAVKKEEEETKEE